MKVLLDTSVLCLSNTDYIAIINHLSEVGIAGGMTYDALILYTALKVDVDRIVTLNEKDFLGIYPNLVDKVIAPSRAKWLSWRANRPASCERLEI